MIDPNNLDDAIAAFVSGRMPAEEKIEFEQMLRDDVALKERLTETQELRWGLRIIDSANRGHIESELLVLYAEDMNELDETNRRLISEHLEECESCREELELCKPEPLPQVIPETRSSSVTEFLRWLFAPRFAFRPAYGLIALVLLAVPITYVSLQTDVTHPLIAVDLIPSGTRGESDDRNHIAITDPNQIVRVQVALPVRANSAVRIRLSAEDDSSVLLERMDRLTGNALVIDIPASYFVHDGQYVMTVHVASDAGVADEPFEYPIRISHN